MDVTYECPHCGGTVVTAKNELNCGIFRHAAYKNTLKPLHPHASKAQCDALFEAGAVVGCARPFKLVLEGGLYKAVKCDYV
jgi:hypothetical protein